jgi:hypothetical protein
MPIYQLFTLNFLLTIYQQGCLNFYTIPPKISYKKNSSPQQQHPHSTKKSRQNSGTYFYTYMYIYTICH